MTEQATEEDVLKILRYMTAAWPRAEISAETVAVYVMHLLRSRLAADVLLLAAMALVDTLTFFPSVAELTGKAAEIEGERQCWYVTANYRLHGEDLPAGLRLPAGMGRQVLGIKTAELVDRVDEVGRQESAQVGVAVAARRNGSGGMR